MDDPQLGLFLAQYLRDLKELIKTWRDVEPTDAMGEVYARCATDLERWLERHKEQAQ